MSEIRLGDILDDYCSRCKLLTNHSVVSLLNGEPAKVHCRTCFFEHNYGHGKNMEKKKASSKKAKLFDEVLSSITGAPAQAEEPPEKKEN
jgi:hypothetical protein